MALVVAVAVAGAVVAARPASVPRVTVLDVGQGDAILVEGSRGGRLLVDGGPDPDRLLVALDRRIPPWDRRIDAVILSHPHEDHVAGLALLLERYDVDRVFEPGMRGPGPGYAAWLRELAGPGAPISSASPPATDWPSTRSSSACSGRFAARCPASRPTAARASTTSRSSSSARSGRGAFLLMGDVEEGIDPSLLAAGLPRVDLLKVAHHGSRTATTQAFVDAVRPAVAIASAGAGNPYGHPARATMDRLAAAGARVLRTDRDGTVVAAFEPDGMTVRTEGARAAASVTTRDLRVTGLRRTPPASRASLGRTGARVPLRDPGHRTGPGPGDAAAIPDQAADRPGPVAPGPSGTIESMTVPGRVDAASLLLSLDPPPWFVRHARAVAEVAGWLAARIDAAGTPSIGAWSSRRRSCTTSTRRSRPTIRRAPSPTATARPRG